MKDNRSFIVLGLGSFGTALASRLCENGCRVTGVDRDEDRVVAMQDTLYAAVVGDVTQQETLAELLIPNAAAVFVSLGESIEQSILAALHCRDLDAKQIYAKGVSDDHARILRALGVDRVIFPEAEIAVQLADKVTWPNMLELVKIDPEYSIVEISVPASLDGKTLQQADLRRRFGVLVLAIKDALHGSLDVIPGPDHRLSDDQLLVVIGKQEELQGFRDVK